LENISDHSKLTHLDASVATYLSKRYSAEKECVRVSYAMIAKGRCDRRSAMRSVARLINYGFVKSKYRGNSLSHANEYWLVMPGELVTGLVTQLVTEMSVTGDSNHPTLVTETALPSDSLSVSFPYEAPPPPPEGVVVASDNPKKESGSSEEIIPRASEDVRKAQVAAALAQMKAAGFKFESSKRRH
jgi:hypothetical protein